jgi:THO complex subunit 4
VPKRYQDVGNINERVGKAPKKETGMAIKIANLNFDISESDLKELFGTVGKIKKCKVDCDESGRSCGRAQVWFAFKADAITAKKTFDGRTLDDTAMTVVLAGGKSQGGDGNSKATFFGTALNKSHEEGSGGRGRGRGRGRERGSGRGKGNGRGDVSTTVEEMDADMDSYMNKES